MTKHASLKLAVGLTGLIALAGVALAQQHQGHGMNHGAMAPASARDSAATAGYKAANTRMHKDMDIAYSGDADADFVRGMIPHHQGAIDMAKVVLANGKDPALKTLAEGVIADQEKEIAQMRDWLKKNGK
ncbi:DUF305 domain-containing protein [Bosea caraganae]|uniref:DUF305 domain-containing protein n=1 Tax=Bosea caraganae TaxID=2763117 RepID=A0A370L6W3_9HYPH|nr:DUF305 domain-containing protein [Bosea caraganae]RDJ25373.1 DUF305 domain-containing protein [Bosea caraganae]RDJ25842.1 DUF305 domain-containing protein [Bosea caraganae]